MDIYGNQSNVGPIPDYYARDFFAYELDFAALAPAGVANQSFTVQADSDFLWTKAVFFADIAAAAQLSSTLVIPLATVLIQDTGSGRVLMNQAVPLASLFGTGQLPAILPRQRMFKSQSVVTVTLTNFGAAATYNIRLSFIGEKGFRK